MDTILNIVKIIKYKVRSYFLSEITRFFIYLSLFGKKTRESSHIEIFCRILIQIFFIKIDMLISKKYKLLLKLQIIKQENYKILLLIKV